MAEVIHSITSDKPADAVFRQLEDSLSQLGQTSITKKGAISINPKAKYSGFAATTTMEGSVRQKRDSNQYDVSISYSVAPSLACWLIGIIGGLSCIVPAAIFVIPFITAPGSVKSDVQRALQLAEQELE